jgi:hypothetical protein
LRFVLFAVGILLSSLLMLLLMLMMMLMMRGAPVHSAADTLIDTNR